MVVASLIVAGGIYGAGLVLNGAMALRNKRKYNNNPHCYDNIRANIEIKNIAAFAVPMFLGFGIGAVCFVGILSFPISGFVVAGSALFSTVCVITDIWSTFYGTQKGAINKTLEDPLLDPEMLRPLLEDYPEAVSGSLLTKLRYAKNTLDFDKLRLLLSYLTEENAMMKNYDKHPLIYIALDRFARARDAGVRDGMRSVILHLLQFKSVRDYLVLRREHNGRVINDNARFFLNIAHLINDPIPARWRPPLEMKALRVVLSDKDKYMELFGLEKRDFTYGQLNKAFAFLEGKALEEARAQVQAGATA